MLNVIFLVFLAPQMIKTHLHQICYILKFLALSYSKLLSITVHCSWIVITKNKNKNCILFTPTTLSHLSFSFFSHFSLLSSLSVVRRLWSNDCGPSMVVVQRLWAVVGCGPMVMDRGSNDYGFDFGLWVLVRWS